MINGPAGISPQTGSNPLSHNAEGRTSAHKCVPRFQILVGRPNINTITSINPFLGTNPHISEPIVRLVLFNYNR